MAPSVMVGMSGGVDSAVAAHILKQRGYEIAGLFMKNWEDDDDEAYCTALADFGDAAAICDKLGIELHTANFAAEYWDNVFEAFLADYRKGDTPNPDVLCNREIKFKLFADYASELGFDTVATGHYARRSDHGEPFRLFKGLDANKDQTYFLQAVPAGSTGTLPVSPRRSRQVGGPPTGARSRLRGPRQEGQHRHLLHR